MASEAEFVDFLTGQMKDAGEVYSRKMFGEYTLYCGKKVVALVCNDQLFVKQTVPGREYIERTLGSVEEAPAYEGAKPGFLISESFEDSSWIAELISLTADALPEPKPKKKKSK